MRVILAVSGTLQEGFALRANLDAPGAPAVHLGPGVVRGVKSYLDAKQGNPSPNPACVVTGNDNDANVYELYLVDSEAVLKSLLGEPRYLAMSPDAVQLDLSAAETSAGVAALARNLLGDAAASTCAVLAVVSAVSGAPSYVPTPSDRANGMTDFASGLRLAAAGGLLAGAADAASPRPAPPRLSTALSEDGAAAALAATGFFATAAQARAALGAAAAPAVFAVAVAAPTAPTTPAPTTPVPPKAVVAAPARLERAVRRHGASVAAACLATGLAAALARRRPSAHAISLIGAAFAAGALSARFFASTAADREVRAMVARAVREALPGADKGDVDIQCEYDRLFGMCQHDTAVVCIDLQTDFVDSANGRLAKFYDPKKLEAVSAAVANAARLLAAARKAGLTVAHSRSHRYGASIRRDLVGVGDAGYELFPAVAAMPGEIVVDKWTFGAFASTQLEAELRARGVRRILLCGVLTNVCVFATAVQAVDRFFRVCLVEDACASFSRDWHENAVKLINEPQRVPGHAQKATGLYFGEVSTVDRVQAALKSLP